MVDFEKVEQAKELLKESNAKFVLAWQNAEETRTNTVMKCSYDNAINNILALVNDVAEAMAGDDEFTKDEKIKFKTLFVNGVIELFNKAYSNSEV